MAPRASFRKDDRCWLFCSSLYFIYFSFDNCSNLISLDLFIEIPTFIIYITFLKFYFKHFCNARIFFSKEVFMSMLRIHFGLMIEISSLILLSFNSILELFIYFTIFEVKSIINNGNVLIKFRWFFSIIKSIIFNSLIRLMSLWLVLNKWYWWIIFLIYVIMLMVFMVAFTVSVKQSVLQRSFETWIITFLLPTFEKILRRFSISMPL